MSGSTSQMRSVISELRLILLTDVARAGSDDAFLQRFEAACALASPRSVAVQLRDRELGVRERLDLGRQLRAATRRTGQHLIVNDRLDLALIVQADGVHLGEASVEVSDARRVLPPGAIVTQACHDASRYFAALREALSSAADQALVPDALLLSPAMARRKGNPVLGVGGLERAVRLRNGFSQESRLLDMRPRLFALGGVHARNAATCLASGVDGVAVMGALADTEDPGPLLEALGVLRADESS